MVGTLAGAWYRHGLQERRELEGAAVRLLLALPRLHAWLTLNRFARDPADLEGFQTALAEYLVAASRVSANTPYLQLAHQAEILSQMREYETGAFDELRNAIRAAHENLGYFVELQQEALAERSTGAG